MTEAIVNNVEMYLQLLPEFNGDLNVLTRFIDLCDTLVDKYLKDVPDQHFINLFVVSGILNKITGAAAQCVRLNNVNSWPDIKKILLERFADQRDEATLCSELCLLIQGPRSVQEFYDKIKNMYSNIMSLVAVNDELPTTIEAKKKLYEKISLKTFLCGLNEPLGSRVRCTHPKGIDIAFQYALEEQNAINTHELMMQRNCGFTLSNSVPSKSNIPQNKLFGQSAPAFGTFGSASPTQSVKGPTGIVPLVNNQSNKDNQFTKGNQKFF